MNLAARQIPPSRGSADAGERQGVAAGARAALQKARALDLKLPLLETFTLLLGAIDRARAG